MLKKQKQEGKVIAWILISMIIGLLVNCHFWLKHEDKLNKIADDKLAAEKLAYQKKLKIACQFPDGYAPTGSGVWFDLKKFNNANFKAIHEAKELAGKDTYKTLPEIINYTIDKKGACYITGFGMSMLWNGRVLKPNYVSSYVNFPPNGWTNIQASICVDSQCTAGAEMSRQSINNGLSPLHASPHQGCHNKHEFLMTHYKNLIFRIEECDINQEGKYTGWSNRSLPNILEVKGLDNYGFGYRFNCTGLSISSEQLPISIINLQQRQELTGKITCLAPSEATFSRLFFDGGHISISFETYVLSEILPFLKSVQVYPSQFITKEKSR